MDIITARLLLGLKIVFTIINVWWTFPSQFIYVTLFNPYVHVSYDWNVILLLFTGCIMSFVYCLVSASKLCYFFCVYGVFQVQSVGGHTASFIIFVSITETIKSIFAVLKCVNQIIHFLRSERQILCTLHKPLKTTNFSPNRTQCKYLSLLLHAMTVSF